MPPDGVATLPGARIPCRTTMETAEAALSVATPWERYRVAPNAGAPSSRVTVAGLLRSFAPPRAGSTTGRSSILGLRRQARRRRDHLRMASELGVLLLQ